MAKGNNRKREINKKLVIVLSNVELSQKLRQHIYEFINAYNWMMSLGVSPKILSFFKVGYDKLIEEFKGARDYIVSEKERKEFLKLMRKNFLKDNGKDKK